MGSEHASQTWLLFSATEAIPAYSVVAVSGESRLTDNSSVIISVGQPDGNNLDYWITNRAAVESGDMGTMNDGFEPVIARWSGATSPVYGETWGPKAGQFTLDKDGTGLRILKVLTEDLALVIRSNGSGSSFTLAKLTTPLSAGGTATAEPWQWPAGESPSKIDGSDPIDVDDWLLESGEEIASGKKVILAKIGSRYILMARFPGGESTPPTGVEITVITAIACNPTGGIDYETAVATVLDVADEE